MKSRFVILGVVTAALSMYVPGSWGTVLAGAQPHGGSALLPLVRSAAFAGGAAGALQSGIVAAPSPAAVGIQAAGTFDDATGHSGQSHLVYAANSRVWWLFTLTSAGDAQGGTNHIVKAYRSSGPDLATATWIAAADSPGAASGSPNGFLGGGRSLAVAYVNNSPVDVIHADISMAFDGQNGRTGHIRAVVTGTTITWSTWNLFDEPAATWAIPRGNAIGVSTGKTIHTAGTTLQQEVDANLRRSTSPDTGSTWTSGFSVPAVVDGSMINQCNAVTLAPLANDVMLAVYDNGQNFEPNLTNLRFKRSAATGTWPGIVVGSQTGGDGNVFATTALIDQNDWALVPVTTTQIYAFRRNANGSGLDAASYNAATNGWSALSSAPPLFGSGQSAKAGAGVFGATDGVNVWLAVVNTDLANTILWTRFDGVTWTPWAAVPGTDIGIHNRKYVAGSPQVGSNQVGLIWTEGNSLYDIYATSFVAAPDVTRPTVSITAPASGASVSATVAVTASASDNVGVAGVQFRVDGVNLGGEITAAPYTTSWSTITAANGTHTLTAIARDAAGNTTTSAAVSVTVSNVQTPIITWLPPTRIAAGTPLGALQLNATANTAGTFAYAPPAGTVLPAGLGQVLSTVFTPADTIAFTTATASVTIDVVNVVPDVVGLTNAAATSAIAGAGLVVGIVTQAPSATVPAGSVISETPAAGTAVAAGSRVDLVVSSGPIVVPNVVGLTQAAASSAITGAGLTVGAITSAASATVPAGSVISQTPAAGAQVGSGTAIALVVSSGPPSVSVPSVVGLTQASATTAITNAGLTVGVVTTSASSTVPAGSVISQNPAAGTQATSGSAVALNVSSGPPPVAVPSVVGLTQTAATTALSNAGLRVGLVTTASSTTVPAGSVISQTPAAGTQVTAGSAVALVVSSGPPQVAVPSVVGLTQAAAVSALTNAGLAAGAITTASSTTVAAGSVIDQKPAAGTQVATGTTVSLVVSSGPPQVAVPNVVGLTQAAATTAITSAGLTVGVVSTAPSTMIPTGAVMSQTPSAGLQVASGSAVDLVVSSGPAQVVVPSVIGLSQSAAGTTLANAGLVVGTVTESVNLTVPAGSVLSQSPAEATLVAPGTAVNLVVAVSQPGRPQVNTTVSVDGTGTVNTPPFSVAAGELLVALASSDNFLGPQTLAISGGGLNWTLVRRANAQSGTAEIWTATAPAPLSNVIVSSRPASGTATHQSLTVLSVSNTAGIGASAATSGDRTLAGVMLTTTRAGSLLFAVGHDPDRNTARTVPAGQTIVHQWVDRDAISTFWVQSYVDATSAGSAIALGTTSPSRDAWNFAAVEIVPR